jgi:hypothetical protein
MKRELTKREKTMLAILGVLLVGLLYYKFVLTPINDQIVTLQSDTENDQAMIEASTPQLKKMQAMEKELDELKASGEAKAIPEYDNIKAVMNELHLIMASAKEYSLNFNGTTESDAIVRRPIDMSFTASSYAVARGIIDKLHDSSYTNQISDISYTLADDSAEVKVELLITYYELDPNPQTAASPTDTAAGTASAG